MGIIAICKYLWEAICGKLRMRLNDKCQVPENNERHSGWQHMLQVP